jgi:hypothetical protein
MPPIFSNQLRPVEKYVVSGQRLQENLKNTSNQTQRWSVVSKPFLLKNRLKKKLLKY